MYKLKDTRNTKSLDLKTNDQGNNLIVENSQNYVLMHVPFTKDIITFLKNIHSKILHRGVNGLRLELIKRRIYYFGISKDIKRVISECAICKIKNSKVKLYKKEKFKTIIFKRPRDRYIADITQIPIEFLNNKQNKYYKENITFKYILTILDHFSKFADSFLLPDKAQKTVLEKIKIFFDFYGIPKEFGTDNGREFINPSINNYLNNNNVKLINGLPYNPRSQGGVERIHITIRNSLLALYLENSIDFNLELSLKK